MIFKEFGLEAEDEDFDEIEVALNNLDCYIKESFLTFDKFLAINEGTWSLPYNTEKAQALKDLIDGLENNPEGNFDIEGHGKTFTKKDLYHLLGNDSLFDALGSLQQDGILNNHTAAIEIKDSLKYFIEEYESNPSSFKDKFSDEALEILRSILN
jgi:hypothetical protein